jgi:hypothetical protein
MLNEPAKDSDQKYGHKFPYFACEVLCSENVFLLEKYFEDVNKQEENREEDEHSDNHQEEANENNHQKLNIKEKYFDEEKGEEQEQSNEDKEQVGKEEKVNQNEEDGETNNNNGINYIIYL